MFTVRAIGLGHVGADLPDGVRGVRPLGKSLDAVGAMDEPDFPAIEASRHAAAISLMPVTGHDTDCGIPLTDGTA